MSEPVCNYVIARFRPDPESGEFVNIGVVLMCPALNYLGYEFQTHDHRRVAGFFPDLDMGMFQRGLDGLLAELARIAESPAADTSVVREEAHPLRDRFAELVRPRESMFRFGEVATAMTADPPAKLRELFERHVGRHSDRAVNAR